MKLPSSLLAPLVTLAFLGAMLAGGNWELPTMRHRFVETPAQTRSLRLTVQGLKCRGTSNFFVSMVRELPGVVAVSTYVQEFKAEIDYDASRLDPERIVSFIEKPVQLSDGRVVRPFKVLAVED